MQTAKQAMLLLVRSHLFIAACAGLMVHYTASLFHLDDTGIPYFVMGATLVTYTLHRLLNGRKGHPEKTFQGSYPLSGFSFPVLLLGLSLIGSAATLILNAPYPILATIVPTMLYLFMLHDPKGRLRWLGAIKTLLLASTWTYITCLLPFLLQHEQPTSNAITFFLNRFLLIYGICLLFDNRDRALDKQKKLETLPVRLSSGGLKTIFYGCMVAFFLTVFQLERGGLSGAQLSAILLPGIVLTILFNHALKNHSELLYYVVLDGLMAVTPLTSYIMPFQ